MTVLGSTILLVCVVLSADAAWVALRDWRAKRAAIRQGRTLTAKFAQPHF